MITNEGGILIHTMAYTIINHSCETDVFNLITFFLLPLQHNCFIHEISNTLGHCDGS